MQTFLTNRGFVNLRFYSLKALKKWAFRLLHFELGLFNLKMHRAHCVWLKFTSGHLAMAHRSVIVSILWHCWENKQSLGRWVDATHHCRAWWQKKLACSSFRVFHVQNFAKHMFRRLDASWRHCSQSQRLHLPMHIWYVRYSQTSHSPSSRSKQGAQAEWKSGQQYQGFTFHCSISGRNSQCIQVFENQKERKRQKDSHIYKFLSCCRLA